MIGHVPSHITRQTPIQLKRESIFKKCLFKKFILNTYSQIFDFSYIPAERFLLLNIVSLFVTLLSRFSL